LTFAAPAGEDAGMSDEGLEQAIRFQAEGCRKLGSPFYAALLERAAGGLGDPRVAALFEPWRGAGVEVQVAEATPLRLLGALHDLVLSGEEPALAAAFPPTGNPEEAWRAALEATERHAGRLTRFMAHEPQTNEVRRSAVLAPGMLTIAAETGLPLRCFELGASAGLNQLWSRFRYDFGPAGVWGDEGSPVRLDTEWSGLAPTFPASVRVLETAACDRRPVDIADPAQRRRLRAYLWPDQPERMARLDAALALADAAGVAVETADAVDWTRRRVRPAAGAATVLVHSSFWQYLPRESQEALAAVIAGLGASASREAPFAWLRKEPMPIRDELRLTLWPGGQDRLLAYAHPHGAWIEWVADAGSED
jgi:hypothetical protein